jgi:pentapeptide repeat protein
MNARAAVTPGDRRQLLGSDQLSSHQLSADCSNCVGLCCVALAFAKSADFAFEKDAGEECVNLQDDFRCGIHPELREHGFKGCTVFDCFGAGQKVTQSTFNAQSWRDDADVRRSMFAVFPIMRQLHEMLWYLADAASRPQAQTIRQQVGAAYEQTLQLTEYAPAELQAIDVDAHRGAVNQVLARVSVLVRGGIQTGKQPAGPDLIGANLAHHDLRGADLRGALLIAADLVYADLRQADVIGADFRDANVRGADLSTTLYLTQFQVNAANGDAVTKLPATLERPGHWLTTP